MDNLVGRSGLARVLEVSEKTARAIEIRGEIAPEVVIEGRPLFSVPKARALRERREAERLERLQRRIDRQTQNAA